MSSPLGGPSGIRLTDLDLGELPGALIAYGADGRVLDATPAAVEIIGEAREQLIWWRPCRTSPRWSAR